MVSMKPADCLGKANLFGMGAQFKALARPVHMFAYCSPYTWACHATTGRVTESTCLSS